jgi:hypothetical protein
MGKIQVNKKYDFLVTTGCSFTSGHLLEEEGQWGEYLADKLNTQHINLSQQASSNYFIYNALINFCEKNKNKDFCVGIQWSEFTRREIWLKSKGDYICYTHNDLLNPYIDENDHEEFLFMRKYHKEFTTMFVDMDDMLWRTIMSMISITSYLKYNNIDFVMFEGIGSVMDYESNNKVLPIDNNFKKSVLSNQEFFTTYGNMRDYMVTHELYKNVNDGHPNIEFVKWWVDKLYNYLSTDTIQ